MRKMGKFQPPAIAVISSHPMTTPLTRIGGKGERMGRPFQVIFRSFQVIQAATRVARLPKKMSSNPRMLVPVTMP